MQNNPHLKKCIQLITEKTGWGDFKAWTHPQFVNLSKLIFEKCGVLISVSSLKRIFGKISSLHEPQRETRNALARFLDYDNWDDFTSKNPLGFNQQKNQNKRFSKRSMLFMTAAILMLCLTSYYFILQKVKENATEKISFSGKYLTGSSPHSVVFQYNIEGLMDSIYIRYDDDFTEVAQETLDPRLHTITHRYILPDLYKIELIHNNKPIRNIQVNLVTNGWQTYLGYDKLTKFYPFGRDSATGRLEVNPQKAFELGLFEKDEKVLVKHRLVKDFGIIGDHCTLKAKVADLKKLKTLDCFLASFVIHGDSGKINISFAQNDCFERAYLKFGDKVLDGRYSDLSVLATDFTCWQELEITVENHILTLRINNEKRLELPFPITMGKIRALLFDTPLSGAMDDIEFKDTHTGVNYKDAF